MLQLHRDKHYKWAQNHIQHRITNPLNQASGQGWIQRGGGEGGDRPPGLVQIIYLFKKVH